MHNTTIVTKRWGKYLHSATDKCYWWRTFSNRHRKPQRTISLKEIVPNIDSRCLEAIEYFIKKDGFKALYIPSFFQLESDDELITERYILITENTAIYIYLMDGSFIIEAEGEGIFGKDDSPEYCWEKLSKYLKD